MCEQQGANKSLHTRSQIGAFAVLLALLQGCCVPYFMPHTRSCV